MPLGAGQRYAKYMIVELDSGNPNLEELVTRAAQGEEVELQKAGQTVGWVLALHRPSGSPPPREPGLLKGKIWMADDFDEFTPELEEMFYGSIEPKEPHKHLITEAKESPKSPKPRS